MSKRNVRVQMQQVDQNNMQDSPKYGMFSMQVCKKSWGGLGEGVAAGTILSVSPVIDQCPVQGVYCLSLSTCCDGFQQSLDAGYKKETMDRHHLHYSSSTLSLMRCNYTKLCYSV